MASQNFTVNNGITAGAININASTGDVNTVGNVVIGTTVIHGSSGNINVGGTTINGTTGAINTPTLLVNGTPISPAGGSFTNATITTSTINSTSIGDTVASTGKFTTLDATGTVTTNDILPHVTNVSNIGSPTQRFSTIYVNEAKLSTNTLYLGDTPILGTTNNVINIHADPGQAISMQTSGAAGNMSFVSNAQMTHQTTGNNADILVQSNGTGSKTRVLSATAIEMTAPSIPVVGNVTVTGLTTTNDIVVNGNITVTGTQAAVNAAELSVKDNVVIINAGETGIGVTAGLAGIQFARGQVASYQLAFRESDDSLQFGPVGATTKVAVENGSGQIVGNITGSAASATTAGTVTAAAQPAITSVGTLTSLATSGDATIGANLTVAGNLTVNGTTTSINATNLDVADLNITVAKNAATAAAANGAGLTVAGANATLTYGSASDNFVFNKRIDATSFYGSGIGLSAIPNAALTNSSVTVTAGAGLSGGGVVSLGGAVTLSNAGVTGLTGGGGITVSGSAGAVTLGSTATSANTASAIVARDASGNFSAGTITASLTGTASNASLLQGYGVSATAGILNRVVLADSNGYINNTYFSSSDNSAASGVTAVMVKVGDNYLRSGTSAAISTFLGLTSSATTANATTNTANTLVLRDSAGSFSANVVTATATVARYADLAEKYTSDAQYEPGTVVSFGGDAEVTLSKRDGDRRVAGVVTTAPAYLMNSELEGVSVAIALQGRVPCKVTGKIKKGDMLISAGDGYARADVNPIPGQMLGKSLEDFDGVYGVIEVAVGRM